MKSYLIRITTKEELKDWKEFTKLAKSKGLEIKEALFQSIRLGLPSEKQELTEIKERLRIIEELVRYDSPSRIDSKKSFEGVEGKHRQSETKQKTTKQTEKEELAKEINRLKGKTVKELCEQAGIEYRKQGLSKFSEPDLNAMMNAIKQGL